MQRAIVWLTEMNDLAQHCKLVWSMSYKSNETSQWVCYFDLFMAKCFVSVLLFIVAAYLIFEKKNKPLAVGLLTETYCTIDNMHLFTIHSGVFSSMTHFSIAPRVHPSIFDIT